MVFRGEVRGGYRAGPDRLGRSGRMRIQKERLHKGDRPGMRGREDSDVPMGAIMTSLNTIRMLSVMRSTCNLFLC